MKNKILLGIFCTCLLLACQDRLLPKPKALLRLEYPDAGQISLETDHFSITRSVLSKIKNWEGNSFTVDYPTMHASVFITYKKVDDNLNKLLTDAQKLSYEHVVKADGIYEEQVENRDHRVYGMYYEVRGNAASQAQFYLTDSTGHFVTGSLYFYAKPNYDSILPAAAYLQNDIRELIKSLRWKE
ncbi:MAG TPA: gliding motility lipoprotein GldD [Arenibacter sp.]|nr:gliding motility lipoprotein GldD [Arenibacter sp.]